MALNPLFPDEEPRALSVGKPNIPDFIPEAETKTPGTPSVPQVKIADFIPEAAGQGKPADFIPEAPLESMTPEQQDAVSRVDRLLAKGEAARTEVDRSYPGEIAASLGRGGVAVAKLPVQVTKIIGADILGSKTVKRATEPILESMEDFAESPLLKPGKEAGGKPIDLDRIISNPGEVIGQITSQATNPRFWASQLPEGAMSMVPAILGSWAPRAVALSGKLGVALEAAQAAGRTAEVAAIAKKLNRLSTIGMYGVSMAMEAGQAEEKVRAYEEKTGKEVAWAPKVAAILGTGIVAGGLEAFSLGRVLYGKGGGEISVPQMIGKIFEGKDGRLIAHKILDSVATEGITEGAQSLVENAAAKWGFDPDQKLTEGIVESVLIGAALGLGGGAFEGAKVRHEAAKAILEKKRLAEEEYQSTMRADQGASLMAADQGAALEDVYAGMPDVQAVPEVPPVEPVAPEYTVTEPQRPEAITQTEPPGGSSIVDQFGQPIYEAARQDALDAAMRKEPWDRNAHEKWLVDQATKGAAPVLGPDGKVVSGPGAEVAPEPMGTPTSEIEVAAPVQPAQPEAVPVSEIPAVPDLRTRVSQLIAAVDESGDPGAAQELTQLLISNQKEVGDLFRIPDQEIPGLKHIADRLDSLIRQVDATGEGAEELHRLLSASQNVLSGVSRWEIAKTAGKDLGPEPMVPSNLEVTEVSSQPTTPPPAPKGNGFDQTFEEFHAEHLPTFIYGNPDSTPEEIQAFTSELHKLTVDTALADGRLSPQDAEKLGHFDRYLDLAEQYRPRRGLPGAKVKATTARGTSIDAQYELMDINDLITSHDDNLTINPAFPQELQPRERSRVGSQLQVAQIEQNLQPGYLGESPGASEGAPIIGHDNLVESGNARTIALRRLYGRQGAEVYRQWLRDNAHRFGIAPGQTDQMQTPILVRRRLTDLDRKQFVREANEPTVAAMSAVEIARSDAAILKDLDILQHFTPNDKGTISTSDNLLFINRFMERVVGPTERNRFQTSKGFLNQDGERRIRNALFALAFGDSAALEKLAESTDDNARNITGAMTMVAARLAFLNKEIAKGNLYDLNITDEISQAADILQSLRDQGITVEDYLAQQKLFTDIDPMVAELLQVFSRFARSRVKLAAIFNGYADALEDVGNPRQMELLGPKLDISKAELLQAALEKVGEQYGKGSDESVPTDVQPDEATSGSVAPEADGAVGSQEASEEGGEDGASPPVPDEEVTPDFGLTGGKPKTTAFEARLAELKDEYPDIDLDRAATVLRAFPNAENGQIVNMAADPEMFSQVARGNLSAEEQRLLLEKAANVGQQGVLPGLDEGAGDLFDQPPPKTPTPPKSNMDILVELPAGAWQSFDKAFTDAEMELIPKAIDAKMISVKTVDGKVRYSRTGDLGTWLADNPATGPTKFSMENGRVQVEIMPKSSVGGKPQQNFRVNGQWIIGLKELKDKWPVVYDRVIADYPDIAPKTEKPQKPADLNTAFTDLINVAFDHPNPPGPITPKDVANIAKKTLGISQEDLPQRRKEIEEAFEFALVQKAREIVEAHKGKDPLIAFSFLKKLYSTQPALTSRTSSSVANQAYSTPAPLAYLMSQWAGINPESWVYEPTGGNGMLLIGANPEQAWANELDPGRAENLKAQGFDVTTEDAKKLVGTPKGPQEKSVDVVVANPPFGSMEKPVDFDGYKITKLEHLIALDALKAMDDDGRAAIILGGHSFFTPWGALMAKLTDADRIFFNYLYSRYNVTHHINVDGKVYERMGTKFPIRLITIEGRKAQPDKAAGPVRVAQIELAKTLDSVYTLIKGDIDNAAVAPGVSEKQPTSPSGPGSAPAGTGSQEGTQPGPVPGSLEGQGAGTADTDTEGVAGQPPRGPRHPAGPWTPGGGPVSGGGRPGGRPSGSPPVAPGSGGTGGSPGVSPRPKPGEQKGPSAPLPPGATPEPGGRGDQSGRVPPKSIGSGTQVRLPDGRIVTIKEEATPYLSLKEEAAAYGEQTVEIVDADGNVQRIPISQIQGVIDESGQEVQLSDQDRKELRVFQKGQQIETNSGVTGQVTKVRGWGDKMVLTVQGPEGAVTVKPADVKIITEQKTEQSPGEGPPPEGTKPETKPPANASEETKLQVAYVPTSKGRSMNTVAPRYMAEAVSSYLKNLQEEIGDLDEFVRDRLGYKTKDDLFAVMGAEQIEGVALAIDAIERGTGGFVIGHQTGVGKGRMVAAIMRYAKNQGLVPIFLTENDGLFSSMYRDMQDIKSKMNPLILASNKNRARITDISGNVIRELDLNAIQEAVRLGTLPPRFDAIFTTYYQINNRTTTGKMALLSNLASRSIVILDESHKGAGDKSQTGAFLRNDITPVARGVIYSSATYAKRPDTMGLYHRTELGNLNVDLDTIVDNLVRGGVPLQEWVAHQWALSGQMVRNELSFAGVDIPVEVDTENAARDRQRSDDLTQNLRGILSFSRAFSRWVADLNDEFQEAGEEAQPGFRGGISSTGFASVMHNKIAQMLFALRTDATIKEALAALGQGKKVVIGCYNTMEAFLNVMLDSGAVKVGDEVNMNFAQVLRKAADSVRKYTVKQHNGEKETRHVRVEEMPENLQAMWHALIAMIDNTVTDVPAMPIDTIAKALAKEGYKVGEITGRTHVLDWTEEKNILRKRSDKEKYDKATPVNDFNSGALDALIINSSGSTGISLHSSTTFKDQRPRHMILTQMSNEINEAVQLLGRIHRTGQVNKPSYMIKISSLPGEKRPLAILQKKLATLFANVSGKGESAYSLEVNDIINQYGDLVIAGMFADDPDLNERLSGVLDSKIRLDDHSFLDADRDGRVQQILRAFPEDGSLTKKVTGWAALQPVATQEEVWSAIDAKYEELVENLKQLGEYNLESEHLDLQARPVARTILAVGDESGKSELSSPTYFESVDAKIQRKPMTAKDIMTRIDVHLKGKDPRALANEMKEQVEADFGPWLEDKLALMRGAGNAPENIERFEQGARNALEFTLCHLDDYRVGTAVNYPLLNMTGVIYDIKYRPATGSNPATPGNLKITMAVDSTMRTFKTSMAGIGNTVRYTMSVQDGWLDGSPESPGWDDRVAALSTRPYERRYIVTGNLLGNPLDRGQMAYFTREGGELTSGFVMPLNFDPSGYPELQTVSLNQDQAIRILRSEGTITGGDVNFRTNPGPFTIVVPAARKTGGKYYLNEKILSHVEHGDFHKIGNSMQAQIDGVENLRAIVDLLYGDHSIVMQTPRATFARVIGVQQDGAHQPLQVAESKDAYKAKTTVTLGRQIVPNPKVMAESQAEEMRIAYGSESAAQEVVKKGMAKARRAVQRQVSGAAVPGSVQDYRNKVVTEYGDQKWVNLAGRRLTPGQEAYEIAQLFQIFRSPKQENFHVIYTDEKGRILAHNMLSSGTLNSVNMGIAWLLSDVKSTAARLGATKMHFMHNHPSGDPKMSFGDKMAFNSLYQGLPDVNLKGLDDLMGEFVVIDHGKMSYIANGMEFQGYFKSTPGMGDWLNKKVKISDPGSLANFVASLRYEGDRTDANKITLVFTNTKNQVQGWTVNRKEMLTKPIGKVRETLMQMARAYDASQVSIILGDPNVMEGFLTQVARDTNGSLEGWVMDIQTPEGDSIRREIPELWKAGEKKSVPALTKGFLFEEKAEYDAQDQADIDAFREKHIVPQPEEKKALKDRLTEKLRTIYDQTIDRWGSWERAADRATRGGAVVPAGENIVNSLSYLRGVEGRVRQGIAGEWVYQDAKGFDDNLGMGVFTGDEMVRKGPSLKVRLEELKKLADKRGASYDEATKDLETFMVAQRDLELAGETGTREQGEIKGVHPEESHRVIEAIQRKYGEDYKDLIAVADSVREWGDEMILQPLLQAGFIDAETYAKIKDRNQYYIPYKRLLDDVESYIAANAAAIGVPGRVIKEIKGSERKVLDPLQMWIDLAHKAAYAYAKNRTIRSVYVTAKAAEWQDVKEIPAKYLPVDFVQKQEVDSKLRPQLVGLANDLGIKVRMVAKMRGRRLGQFKSWINQEVKDGKLTLEMAKEITVRFATFESTMAHELGHGIDEAFGLVKLLIENGTPEMKKELNRVADQRSGDAPSKSYKRYIRKKEEQVAEFVSRYIIDRRSVERLAPNALSKFEGFLRQNPTLKPLLSFRLSHQAGMLDFGNRVWARSPLPPEPGTLPYFRDGKQRWLKLPPDMYQATQSAMPSEMGILMRIAKFPADTLRAGAIMVPEFALARNPARDVVQAWLFSRFGFSPFKWVKDAAGLISNDANTQELKRQWEAGGGPLAALAQSFVDPEKITTESIMGDPKKFRYFAHPLDALRYASAFLENLTRFSIYKQAREKGLTHAEAVHEARRTTLDFARSGGHPTVRYLNMIIPFWNASIQGMDKLVTELTGSNKKAVYRRLGMLAGVSILIWLYAHQDDRYKELEDWEKNYFWHLPLGPNVPMLRIPKPFEAGVLFGSTFERLMEWGRGENKGGVQSALKAAWEAATPEVIPTIARPYVENWSNYDFFRGRAIEDAALQRLPVQLRAKPWTTATAKAISKYAPISISPVQVEHFIRTWGGGLGANYYLPGADVILRKAGVLEDIPQPAREKIQSVWGVRSFFTQNPTGYRAKSVNDFFERYQEVVQADAGWKALWNAGQKEDLDKFLAAHPEAMFARVAHKYINEMGKIKKERNAILQNKTMTSDQKKEKLDLLDEKVVKLAKAGNAFMSQDVAEALKMPSRFTSEAGNRKSIGMDAYYKMVVESVGDAFEEVKKDSRVFSMEAEARNKHLTSLLHQMREEYKPIKTGRGEIDEALKPFRFKSLFDKPSRRQRAEWSDNFGPRRSPFLSL